MFVARRAAQSQVQDARDTRTQLPFFFPQAVKIQATQNPEGKAADEDSRLRPFRATGAKTR